MALETLAAVMRRAQDKGDRELLEAAARHVLPKVRPIVLSVAGWLEPTDLEDLHQTVLATMWRDFVKLSSKPLLIWEERFGMAFWRKCVTEARKRVRASKRDARLHTELENQGARSESGDLADRVRSLSPADIAVVLRKLPTKQRQAVTLAWLERRPIAGDGSVAKLMAISATMVYRHLRLAEARIAWLRESDPDLRQLLGLDE